MQLRDHLHDWMATTWGKLYTSFALMVSNFFGAVTLDGAYKVALLLLALANLVWAVLNIRKLRREEREHEFKVGGTE